MNQIKDKIDSSETNKPPTQKWWKNPSVKYRLWFSALIISIILILVAIGIIIFHVKDEKIIKLTTIIGPVSVLLTITIFTFFIKNSYDVKQAKTSENVKRRVKITMLKEQNKYFQTVWLEFYLLFQSKSAGIFKFPYGHRNPLLYLTEERKSQDYMYYAKRVISILEEKLILSVGQYNNAWEEYKVNNPKTEKKELLFKLEYGWQNDIFLKKNGFFTILKNKHNKIDKLINTELYEDEFDAVCEMLQTTLNKQASFIKIVKKFNCWLNNIVFGCVVNETSKHATTNQTKYVVQLFFAMWKILHWKTENFEEILLNLSIFEEQINYFKNINLNEPEKFTFKLREGVINILDQDNIDKLTKIYDTLDEHVNLIKKIEQNLT